MAHPPRPRTDAGYLEAAVRIIFMGGLNRQVVDGKWRGFMEAFSGFDLVTVAAMSEAQVSDLAEDDRIIKYRAKLAAVVKNAGTMLGLAKQNGSFGSYLDTLVVGSGVDKACATLSKDFAYISAEGARNWLYSTGFEVGEVSDKMRAKYAPFGG